MSSRETAKSDRFFVWFATALLCAVALNALGMIAWGINRGFDITDEGLYMLSSRYAEAVPGLSSYHLISNMLPPVSGNRVIDFRVWHLIAQVVSSSVLSLCFMRWFRTLYEGPRWLTLPAVLAAAALGNFFVIAVYPHSLAYNSQANFSILVSASLLFLSAAEDLRKKLPVPNWVLLAFAGLIAGPCALIKAPAFVVFVPSAFLFFILMPGAFGQENSNTLPPTKMQMFKRVLAFSGGIAVSMLAYFGLVESPTVLFGRAMPVLQFQTSGHTVHSQLLHIYMTHFLLICDIFKAEVIPLLLLSFVLPSMVWKFKGKLPLRSPLVWFAVQHVAVLSALVAICFEHKMFKQNFFSPEAFYFLTLILLTQWLGVKIGSASGNVFKLPPNLKDHLLHPSALLVGLVFLGALTFICAFGTGNPLLFHSQIHFCPWFILLTVLAYLLSTSVRSALPVMTSSVLIATFALSQLYDYYVKHPYSLYASLPLQTVMLTTPTNLKGLMVSPSAATCFTDLNRILLTAGYHPGDYVLGLYHMQGLVFAVDGRSPGVPLYAPYKHQMDFNTFYLNKLQEIKPERLFMLVGWKLNEPVISTLKKNGYNFPDDFQLLGAVKSPFKLGELDGVPDPDYLKETIQIYKFVPASKTARPMPVRP